MFRSTRFVWVICVLGGLLRIYQLGGESLWRDEISSATVAQLPLAQIVENRSSDVHPPLYYFLLHYWVALLGSSEFNLRLLSAIFGNASLWPMYKIGRILFNQFVGILSALLLALAEFHIHYSQEAKSYSLLTLLTLLSFLSLIKLLEDRKFFVCGLYVVVNTLLIYTHPYGYFILISQHFFFLYLFFSGTEKNTFTVKEWLTLQSIPLVLYLPWVQIFLNQIYKQQEGFWLETPTISSVERTFSDYAGSRASLILLLFIMAFPYIQHAIGKGKNAENEQSRLLEKRGPRSSNSANWSFALLFSWLLTPVLLPFAISQVATPVYLTRGAGSASCALYILVANGVYRIKGDRTLQTLLSSLVFIFFAVNLYEYYTKVEKEQWRELARYVDNQAGPGELVLFSPSFCQHAFDYYSTRRDLAKKGPRDNGNEEAKRRQLIMMSTESDPVWFILCDDRAKRTAMEQMLREAHPHLSRVHFKELDLLRLEKEE